MIRQQYQRLTYLKSDVSMREEYKKMLSQKNAIVDQEFANYLKGNNHISNVQQPDIEKNFKKELDILVKQNALKEQHLNSMVQNQAFSLMDQQQTTEKKKKKKEIKATKLKKKLSIEIKQTERLLPQSNSSPNDDMKKGSFFIYPQFTEELIVSKKQLTIDLILDTLPQKKNSVEIKQSESQHSTHNQSIQKEQSQLEYLKQRFSEIQNQIECVEKEAIFENSTNDQYKFQAKKYETVCNNIRKKISEFKELISMADNRYQNLVEHITLSKQQMQISQNNLNYKNNQLKILQETEQETLDKKKEIYDGEKQELLFQKKRVCELLMKIDFLNEQKKSQLQNIEHLEDQKIFLYEQKQLSGYVEQNISALAKLSEIFLDRKINLNDEETPQQRYSSGSPQTPTRTSKSRMTKYSFQFNKSVLKNEIVSIEDLDSFTNRNGLNSPKPQRKISNQVTKIKQDQKLQKQNSLKIERNRKVDKINRFCESNPDKLIDDLIQIYHQMVLENQSLQSQFENLQKQKIQSNVELRNLSQKVQETIDSISETKTDQQQLEKNTQINQENDEQQCLELELEKATELKNVLETILVNSLYFLLLTLGKHKHLIDEVNDKGEKRVESEYSIDKFDRIELILEKYQKGFMKKKVFEQFLNKKKFQNHSSIVLQKNIMSMLKDKNIPDEELKSAQNSKEKFFFFMEQHNYFPLTFNDLKQTLSFVFPKSFNEQVVQLIIDLTSNDILIRFFLSKDDIIEVIEKCFNAYEYFKQFNMLLTNYEQLIAFSKKQKLQPQGKTPHGSRRLSQYSPFKNPLYNLSKDDHQPKTPKRDQQSSFRQESSSFQQSSSNFAQNLDSQTKFQDKNSQNTIDGEMKDLLLIKVKNSISIQSSRDSIDMVKNIQNTDEDEIEISKRSMSSKSSSESSDGENKSKNSKHLSKINESPINSIVYDEDEFDIEEKEEQALIFKQQEQSILGQYIILQMQKRSIKNFKNTVKEVIDSEKYIFQYIKNYVEKNNLEENRKTLVKAHYLEFNKHQLQSFNNQAEKTLQFKKQREQFLNEKLKQNSDKVEEYEDDDDDLDDNQEEENVIETLNTWKQGFSSQTPTDNSSKFKQNYLEQMFLSSSHQQEFSHKQAKKLMNDSFIMEESQIFGTNQSIVGENHEKSQQLIKKFKQKKAEEILKEDLEKAKNFIVLLSEQNKQKTQPIKNYNPFNNTNLKFKKIETTDHNKQNDHKDQDHQNELNQSKSKKSIQNQIQVYQENTRNKNKKEADYIDSQRKTVKNEISSIQNKGESNQSSTLIQDAQKKQMSNQFEFENLTPVEQQFKKYVEIEENYIKDLKNQDYFVDNLKTFQNDAFFLQKIFILGKNSSSVNLIKKNTKLELPKGLETASYFQKLQDFERKKYNPANSSKENMLTSVQPKLIEEQEKKQTNEMKKSSSISLKSQKINAVYSKFSRQSSISNQANEIKSVLESLKNKIVNTEKQNNQENLIQQKILTETNQQDTLKCQEIKESHKDYIIADKIQNNINKKLESIKSKNMRSLEQLKKIFNVYDSEFGSNLPQLKHQSSNSTVNSRQTSKKYNSSFQSQMSSPFISNCQSYNTSGMDYTKTTQAFNNLNHSKSKSVSNINFVFQNTDRILSQSEALKKIQHKPSPYLNLLDLNKVKPRQTQNQENTQNLSQEQAK